MKLHPRALLYGLFAGSLSVAAMAAQSPTARAAPEPPEVVVEGERPDDMKKVCKQSTPTGSIMPVKTCRTKREWEEIRQRQLAALEQAKEDKEREQHVRESFRNR